MTDLGWDSFGIALKFYRRRVRYTQVELAEACGFSVPYIKKIEAGKIPPEDTLVRLIAELHLDAAEAEELRALVMAEGGTADSGEADAAG